MLNTHLMKQGETVAVALSGGKDSVCLLHMLIRASEKIGVRVKAVNLDHGIRGENSERDSLFVKDLCERLNVPLYYKRIDCPSFSEKNGLSPEEGARILRYKVFEEALSVGFCDKIATAHHASDRAETVLFNILRGTSPLGASGIGETSRGGKIVRPILSLTKAEIDDYALKNSLDYVTDETNFSTDYTRNFLRLEVLPLIEKRFPGAEKSILRFADTLKEDEEYLESLATQALRNSDGEFFLDCDLPNPVFARAAILAMKKLGVKKDYEKKHVKAVISLKSAENGTEISLPKGIIAVKDYGRITLYKKAEKQNFEENFALGEYAYLDKKYRFELVADKTIKKGDNRLIADFSKIPDGCVLRNRRAGDTFTKFGGGTKKLKDYLIDKKIPERKRDELLLLADGKNILIICGIEISDAIRVDKATENVLQCSIYDAE